MFAKITHGYVIQIFDNKGNCLKQDFIAGDEVDYEEDGYAVDTDDIPASILNAYYPFDMEQPK